MSRHSSRRVGVRTHVAQRTLLARTTSRHVTPCLSFRARPQVARRKLSAGITFRLSGPSRAVTGRDVPAPTPRLGRHGSRQSAPEGGNFLRSACRLARNDKHGMKGSSVLHADSVLCATCGLAQNDVGTRIRRAPLYGEPGRQVAMASVPGFETRHGAVDTCVRTPKATLILMK